MNTLEETANELDQELNLIKNQYQQKLNTIYAEINNCRSQLSEIATGKYDNANAVSNILAQKLLLDDKLTATLRAQDIDLAKIRYKKGIEVIKILYEKVLGLDHHFSSLKTHQSIQMISNPNSFPSFKNASSNLKQSLYEKSDIRIPALFQGNGVVSTVYSLLSGFLGGGKANERQANLNDVSCVLDFTIRMSHELNTIYYETEYLINNNLKLKEDCLTLFSEYTDVIEYKVPLDRCRDTDDWEEVELKLDEFIAGIKSAEETGDERLIQTVVNKGHVDLEFSIDRLLSYLEKYEGFINQGENYYKKFAVVVSSYQNEETCIDKLPLQYSSLKDEIGYSIDKFIQAYDIAELKGSKLKDLLYGA